MTVATPLTAPAIRVKDADVIVCESKTVVSTEESDDSADKVNGPNPLTQLMVTD